MARNRFCWSQFITIHTARKWTRESLDEVSAFKLERRTKTNPPVLVTEPHLSGFCRYWLIETRNVDNVTSDARLLYRKLSAVPYLAKFVVYAKVSLDGEEVHLRVFCITDDKTDKTLEGQTGYVEIARSRDVEVCEGRPIYIK